jgi:hypothetical protein
MIKMFLAWRDREATRDTVAYAGAQYALALAYGDEKRAARLKQIIKKLEPTP